MHIIFIINIFISLVKENRLKDKFQYHSYFYIFLRLKFIVILENNDSKFIY